MVGCSPLSYKYKRSMQAVQMPAKKDSKSSKSKGIDIDPDLLFQRILSLFTTEEQMRDAFSHDLAHYPPSLFTDDGFLRTGKNLLCANPLSKIIPFVMSHQISKLGLCIRRRLSSTCYRVGGGFHIQGNNQRISLFRDC